MSYLYNLLKQFLALLLTTTDKYVGNFGVSIIIVGSLLYYCIVNMALMSNNWTQNLYRSLNINENITKILEVKPTDTKVITSVILGIILWNEYRKKSKKGKNKAKLLEKGEA